MSGKKKQVRQTGRAGNCPVPPHGQISPPVYSFKYAGLLAAALGILLYANTFGHNYCYDDYSVITLNSLVHGGIKNIPAIFTTQYDYVTHMYRPMSLAVFALLWQVAPDRPGIYHLFNVLMYGLTGWLLWITWRRILAGFPAGLAAASVLLFMAHPVHTEAVANIKSLDEILALLFFTAALYGLWRFFECPRRGWLAGAAACYGLALLSKESAITFLALFPLTIWFFTDRRLSENLKLSAIFLIPAALFLAVRAAVLTDQPSEFIISIIQNFIGYAPDTSGRFASAFMMCGYYLRALVFLHPLVCDLGYPQLAPVTFADWRALAGLLACAGMAVFALCTLRRKHFLSFAILFFLATFSLCSNIFYLIATSYGERLLYVPSLGFAFALAWCLQRVLGSKKAGGFALFWAACGVLLVLYGVKTVTRTLDWKDNFTLFAADIRTSPDSAHLNYMYGYELLTKGYDEKKGLMLDARLLEQAVERFSHSLKLYPYDFSTWGERGCSYLRLQKYDLAYADYMKTVELYPKNAHALSALGFLCRKFRNEPDRAEGLFRQAMALDPGFMEPRRSLGALLADRQDFEQAVKVWKEALAITPDDVQLHAFIGRAYADMGRPDEALLWQEKAAALHKTGKE